MSPGRRRFGGASAAFLRKDYALPSRSLMPFRRIIPGMNEIFAFLLDFSLPLGAPLALTLAFSRYRNRRSI
jgi:hypothetical protein